MRSLVRRIRRLLGIARLRPCIEVSRFGQRTVRPRVSVSVRSRSGAISVYVFDADEQGEAKATLYSRDLSHITGLPLADIRRPRESDAWLQEREGARAS